MSVGVARTVRSRAVPDMGGTDAARTAWIALASVDGVGDATFERLLEVFGSARGALDAVAGMPSGGADALLARRTGTRGPAGLAARIAAAAREPDAPEHAIAALGGWVLTPLDAGYPGQLADLDPPPRTLFGLGDPELLSAPRLVAVVGTRRATVTGRSLTARLVDRLAASGAVVVSGLAVGIDGAAHSAALASGGRTLAVVGGGLARPGPRAHRGLVRQILGGAGTILAELPPWALPTRGTFPRRNRIISGLAGATVVVEAPLRSGALITARHALEQGRAVYAAPGRPLDPVVAGCLALLRETPARPVVGPAELVEDLGFGSVHPADAALGPMTRSPILAQLGEPERRVAECLARGPASVDMLVRATGLPAGVVAAACALLQMRGWAQASGALLLPAGGLLSLAPEARRSGSPAGAASHAGTGA